MKRIKLKTANKRWAMSIRKNVPFYTLFALVIVGNSSALAECYFDKGYSTLLMRLSLPTSLTVQRDTPIGTVIWTSGKSTAAGTSVILCSGYGEASYIEATKYLAAQTLVAGYTDIYQTKVPGIGFRVRNQGTNSLWAAIPASVAYTVPVATWSYTESKYIFFKMELIYVGGNVSGNLSFASPLASLTTGLVTAGQLYVDGSTTITKVACSLDSTSINVPLGDILVSKFTGVGVSTGDKTFNVGLTCDKDAKINVSLDGTQNADTSQTSVLALTSAGQAGIATGVGVQLLYGGAPLEIKKSILLKTSAGGQETLPFTARYYQTKVVVGAGQANSSATLNITYQ